MSAFEIITAQLTLAILVAHLHSVFLSYLNDFSKCPNSAPLPTLKAYTTSAPSHLAIQLFAPILFSAPPNPITLLAPHRAYEGSWHNHHFDLRSDSEVK